MGVCFSRCELYDPLSAAKVISIDGELHKYAVPVTASRVLRLEAAAASSSDIFICDSDRLYYEECIPAMAPGDELVGGQIYFVLHGSRLNRRVMGQEMAALAVKASLALQKGEERRWGGDRKRRKASVSIWPMAGTAFDGDGYDDVVTGVDVSGRSMSNVRNNSRITRSRSFRRTARVFSFKRGKVAAGSSRLRLSTIYEDK